jgi:hypothetical protein
MRRIFRPLPLSLLILIALLTVPATRDTLRDQFGIFSLFPATVLDGFPKQDLSEQEKSQLARDKLLARVKADHAGDWEIVTGAGLLVSEQAKGEAWLKAAIALAPDKPAIRSALVNRQIISLGYRSKAEYGGAMPAGTKEKFLRPRQVAPLRATLEQWQKLDPQNALPQALLAWADFGEKRDGSGETRLKAIFGSPRIESYYWDLGRAQVRTLQVAGLTDFNAELNGLFLPRYPQWPRLHHLSQISCYQGEVAWRAGKKSRAMAHWLDLVNLGRQLRRQGKNFVENSVGIELEAIGAKPIYQWQERNAASQAKLKPAYPLTGKIERYNGGDIYLGKYYEGFRREAGPALTANLLSGLVQGQDLHGLMREVAMQVMEELNEIQSLHWAGFLMGMELGILAALAGLLGLAARKRPRPPAALRLFWALALSGLALLPTWLYALYLVLRSRALIDSASDAIEPLIVTIPGLYLTPLVLLGLGLLPASWVYAKQKPLASYRLTFLGLFRRTLPVCLLLLVVSYAALTIWCAGLRGEIVGRFSEGDLAPLHRAHPELFQPPAAEAASPHR